MALVDTYIKEIIFHPLFLKLKNVIENIDGWHDHEDVYSHSLKTVERAKKFIGGNFITNLEAKERFLSWTSLDKEGMTISDIIVLTALLHDVGKSLFYKEGSHTLSINVVKIDNQTNCPGHDYWGSLLVIQEILKNIDIPPKAKEHITKVVQLHTIFNGFFFGKEDWTTSNLILYAKAQAEGYYKEAMFNSYCDCYTAPAFAVPAKKIKELFNNSDFYTPREYFIPQ